VQTTKTRVEGNAASPKWHNSAANDVVKQAYASVGLSPDSVAPDGSYTFTGQQYGKLSEMAATGDPRAVAALATVDAIEERRKSVALGQPQGQGAAAAQRQPRMTGLVSAHGQAAAQQPGQPQVRSRRPLADFHAKAAAQQSAQPQGGHLSR
jgi:hypothetical protein